MIAALAPASAALDANCGPPWNRAVSRMTSMRATSVGADFTAASNPSVSTTATHPGVAITTVFSLRLLTFSVICAVERFRASEYMLLAKLGRFWVVLEGSMQGCALEMWCAVVIGAAEERVPKLLEDCGRLGLEMAAEARRLSVPTMSPAYTCMLHMHSNKNLPTAPKNALTRPEISKTQNQYLVLVRCSCLEVLTRGVTLSHSLAIALP